MTEESKTTLFYMLAVAGLIIGSILFTGRVEPLAEEPPASATPTFAKANSTLTLPETDWKVCAVTTQKTAFYMTDMSSLVDDRFVISGTIYASDLMTPLPEVLIEIRPERQPGSFGSFSEPHDYLFQGWARTDATGHYQATVLKPGPGEILSFYYRMRYQNRCPLRLRLFLVDEETGLTQSALNSTLAKLGLTQGEPAGPLLRDTVDIVLPIPPPIPPISPPVEQKEAAGAAQETTLVPGAPAPFRTNLVPPGRIGERLTISGAVYAADCLTPLPGVLIEIWHADPEGHYSFVSPFYFRGKIWTDAAGRYEFTSLKPGRIFSPLLGNQGYQPLHIHYRLSDQGQKPLLTRLFFANDSFLKNLPTPSPGLTISLLKQMRPDGPKWRGGVNLGLPHSSEKVKSC